MAFHFPAALLYPLYYMYKESIMVILSGNILELYFQQKGNI